MIFYETVYKMKIMRKKCNRTNDAAAIIKKKVLRKLIMRSLEVHRMQRDLTQSRQRIFRS